MVKPKSHATLCLLFVLFMLSSMNEPVSPLSDMTQASENLTGHMGEIPEDERNLESHNIYSLADMDSGILDPRLIEHHGNRTSGLVSGRTDSNRNAFINMTIDNATGWVADEARVSLTNLKREYAVNGTFDDGIGGNNTYPSSIDAYPFGWDTTWNDASAGTQTLRTYYNSENSYAVVESIGEMNTDSGYILYYHYNDTYVLWNQTVENVPYSDNMTLSFRFNYESGIIDKYVQISGYVWLVARINGEIYYLTDLLTEVAQRNIWYEYTLSNITGMPTSFDFELGLLMDGLGSSYFEINPGGDYDDDGEIDGSLARVIRVLLDDVALNSVDPPAPEDVELRFHAGSFNNTLVGTAASARTLISYEYWTTGYITTGFTANVSISFDYQVWLLSHYFVNSSYDPHPTRKGVSYAIDLNSSASLSSYLYLGSDKTAVYEDYKLFIYIPPDWDNETIYDPFGNDVSGICSRESGRIVIPESILDRLGWWQIDYQSPNYAKDVVAQRYDDSSSDWENATQFRSGNITRITLELGTDSVDISTISYVNVTWLDSDNSIWSEDTISGLGGIAISGNRTLGGTNTTAGSWIVTISWTNGTEIAYASISFDLYHTAMLTPLYTSVNADQGQTISNFVSFIDSDTGAYLLDDNVHITANWTTGSIIFYSEPTKNRWKADFDTSTVEGGVYTIKVNASRPFFDNLTIDFTLTVTFTTDFMLSNVDDIVNLDVQSTLNLETHFELDNGTDIAGADVSVVYSGRTSGLSIADEQYLSGGNYSIGITAILPGEYSITVTISKEHHYDGEAIFTIIVNQMSADLVCLNGSADSAGFGKDYRMVVYYSNGTGDGRTGANISVTELTPSSGLTFGSVTQEGNGYYSIVFTSSIADIYSIVIRANLTDYETKFLTFTLIVNDVSTSLQPSANSASILINQNYTLQLTYRDVDDIGLESAEITLPNLPTGLSYTVTPLSNGLYNITLVPLVNEATSFQFSIKANQLNYQSATVEFSLFVQSIPTELSIIEGSSSLVMNVYDNEILTFGYVRTDSNQNITSAEISFSVTPSSGLTTSLDTLDGLYHLRISPETTGVWQIVISANKTSFLNAILLIEVEVRQIETSINTITLVESLDYGRSYSFTFDYLMDNGTKVVNSEVAISGIDESWVEISELETGSYNVTLLIYDIGHFDIALEFSRTGFQPKRTVLSVDVGTIEVAVVDIQGLTGVEGETIQLSLRLIEIDSGQPVSEAEVIVQFYVDLVREQTVTLAESGIGIYTGTYLMPSSDYPVNIRIFIDKTNHEFEDQAVYLENTISPTMSGTTLMYRTLMFSSPFILIGLALMTGYTVRRSMNRKKWKENRAALAIKRRFDDVRNLLGIVVLHRHSGVPIYSRMLRGGFDENLISAFITAISQFRGEFDVQQSEWEIVPVSDIIVAIRTTNLVCAFITMNRPSSTQEEQMVKFAQAIGLSFDSKFEEPPLLVIDETTESQFDALLEDMLDIRLHMKHRIVTTTSLPSGPKCLDQVIADLEKTGVVDLDEMAEQITACGLEEARVYKIIWDEIKANHIVPVEGEAMDGKVSVETDVYSIEPRLEEVPEIEAFDQEDDD